MLSGGEGRPSDSTECASGESLVEAGLACSGSDVDLVRAETKVIVIGLEKIECEASGYLIGGGCCFGLSGIERTHNSPGSCSSELQ